MRSRPPAQRIVALFAQPLGKRDKLTATRLLQSLEKILGVAKGDWNWVLVRALWSSLEAVRRRRRHSVEHEETWLILAGFLLRPGFGAALDEVRIDSLWKIRDTGLYFPGKRIKLQEYILWRRVAGGLSRERQEACSPPSSTSSAGRRTRRRSSSSSPARSNASATRARRN